MGALPSTSIVPAILVASLYASSSSAGGNLVTEVNQALETNLELRENLTCLALFWATERRTAHIERGQLGTFFSDQDFANAFARRAEENLKSAGIDTKDPTVAERVEYDVLARSLSYNAVLENMEVSQIYQPLGNLGAQSEAERDFRNDQSECVSILVDIANGTEANPQ